MNMYFGLLCSTFLTRGMIHGKIHFISPGCPRPGIAIQCKIMANNTNHFIFYYYSDFVVSLFFRQFNKALNTCLKYLTPEMLKALYLS